MTPWQIATAAVLALAVAASLARSWRQASTGPRWRRGLLLLLQPACALALYLLLYPPLQRAPADTLVVLTADAPAVVAAPGEAIVALPEAPPHAGASLVPDLATALRQRPATTALRIVGSGLPARDRDAVGSRALSFQPAVVLPGIVHLATPAPVAPGNGFTVQGRVAALPGARVELLDPAGQRMDATTVDAAGRFSLSGPAGVAGDVLAAVRVLDAQGRERDRQPLPLHVVTPKPLKLWILAGAPQPEWKYLRRWAADAGLSLHTQIATGAGLQLGDAPLPFDATTLDGFDVLWLDDRALAGLSRGQRQAIVEAARRGLGVLVRLGGPLDAGARQALAQLGLPMRGGDASAPLAWPPGQGDAAAAPSRRDATPTESLPVLAADAGGASYAWWRAVGQGRIGVTALVDSYRLVLGGAAGAHARLWSTQVSALARARDDHGSAIELPALVWAGERTALCGLGDDAQVRDPQGRAHALLRDPATGAQACAGYWPTQPGWHVLLAAGQARAFFVRDPDQARAWHRQLTAEATGALVRTPGDAVASAAPGQAGSRWPAWWAFIVLFGLCAWLERRRAR